MERTSIVTTVLCTLIAIFLWPQDVKAQNLPALFDVTNVAPDDVLNIRSQPSAKADLIGSLAPNETNVEITALNAAGTWGRLNANERVGWVSMRFLTPVWSLNTNQLPQKLVCSGTEPFWFIKIDRTAEFQQLGITEHRFGDVVGVMASGRPDSFGYSGVNGALRMSTIVSRKECSDGMSDMLYGLSANVMLSNPGNASLFAGCCVLHAE